MEASINHHSHLNNQDHHRPHDHRPQHPYHPRHRFPSPTHQSNHRHHRHHQHHQHHHHWLCYYCVWLMIGFVAALKDDELLHSLPTIEKRYPEMDTMDVKDRPLNVENQLENIDAWYHLKMPAREKDIAKRNAFAWRQRTLRKTLTKSLTNKSLKQKFVEVMPILRVLSKQQRLALSALISAQLNEQKGHELKLEQVIITNA